MNRSKLIGATALASVMSASAAYAEMFEELTGNPINQIVILVVTENGTVQEFIKDKQEYIPLLEETLEEWYETCKKIGQKAPLTKQK